jgi:ribosomal protein S18 acetylase RimI-like enzyme
MSYLPERTFSNPVWYALEGPHRHLSIDGGLARRYPADVSPFAALAEPTPAALSQLASLLAPGDPVWIADAGEWRVPALELEGTLPCLQMVLPLEAPLPTPPNAANGAPIGAREAASVTLEPLGAAEAPEMVALTDAAFPGFFRKSTYRMGAYFGIRDSRRQLIAMGGERLQLPGHPEMSGICTHPTCRGQGLARRVIAHLAEYHRRQGLISWLHVSASNSTAIALYHALGFKTVRTLVLQRIARLD